MPANYENPKMTKTIPTPGFAGAKKDIKSDKVGIPAKLEHQGEVKRVGGSKGAEGKPAMV